MQVGKWLAASVGACLALGMATGASAAVCSGSILYSRVDVNGDVYIIGSWHSTYTQVCNLTTTWKGVTPDICMAMMAKFDAAASLNKTVLLSYPNEATCAGIPTYSSSPAPNFVMLGNS